MGFRINTNVNAVDTQRNLLATSTTMATTMRRLSSGLRINSAADDAAGLAIGQKLNAQVNGLDQAQRNAQDGISLIQTADGALNETQSILQRMRTLAVQASNDTNTATDRVSLQSEMNQLATEMTRISNTTTFNTKNLLAGGFNHQTLAIGANGGEMMRLGLGAMDAASLGVAASGATLSKNTTGITALTNLGSGFTSSATYLVRATTVAAGSLADANGATQMVGSSIAASAQPNAGNEMLTMVGTFAGASAANYVVRVTQASGTQVGSIQYSTDNGVTFANAKATMGTDGTVQFAVQQSSLSGGRGGDSGLTLTFATPANAVAPQVGDQFTFGAAAGQTFVPTTSVGGGTTFAANTPLPLVNAGYDNGTGGTAPTASIAGTYSGPYAGNLSVTTNVLTGAGAVNVWDPGTQLTVQIGGTTIDSSQYSVDTTNNTLKLFGLTVALNMGVGGAGGASGLVTLNEGNTLASGNSGVAGLTSVTVGNSGMTAVPTATATATQSGSVATGLGAGSIVLRISQLGISAGDPYAIDNVGWVANGATAAPTFLTNDFSYDAVAGTNVYTAGHSYGGSTTVTGQDGKQYTLAVSKSDGTGATVTVADGQKTYGTYKVTAQSMSQAGDTILLNLSPQNNAASVAPSHNIGAESATVSGTFTGAQNTAFTAKIATLDNNGNATGIQLSTDGGATYGAAVIGAVNPSGAAFAPNSTTSFDLGNGLTLAVNSAQAGQLNAVAGDAFGFIATATAANGGTGGTVLAMQTTGVGALGTLGGGQLVQNGQSVATVGAGQMLATANFGAPGSPSGLGAGTATVAVTASGAAIFDNTGGMTAATVGAALDITTQADAQAALTKLDAAINTVSATRATLGADQNRLQHTINNLAVESENLNAAQSRIMDVDVAAETVNMTKNQILEQAGISVLSQANQQPQMVLKLLQ